MLFTSPPNILHAVNHHSLKRYKNKEGSAIQKTIFIGNAYRLLSAFAKADKPDDWLLQAELLRELGEFDVAINLLNSMNFSRRIVRGL
jgi:hypothetical protein